MSAGARGRKQPEDVESLVAEIEAAIRESFSDGELAGNIDELVKSVSDAVREAVSGQKQFEDVDSLVEEVHLAVRNGVDSEKLGEDIDSLMDRINKAIRGVFARWLESAESVGQTEEYLRDWLGSVRDRVRRSTREIVVMVRVDKESLERMDELREADLVSSRSAAAAFLISEGVKARQDLFEGIRLRIDTIRQAREELQRLKAEGGFRG